MAASTVDGPRLGAVPGLVMTVVLATLITVAMTWPVVVSPNTLIFGSGIDGWVEDPFIVMLQIGGRVEGHVFTQPVTDGTGWLLAQWLSPI